MEINKDFYLTEKGKNISHIIQKTSICLLKKKYDHIPCSNIKNNLNIAWIQSMEEMLDHYFIKLLPWEPGNLGTSILADTEEYIIVEAPFQQNNKGTIEFADIWMTFKFFNNNLSHFEGIHY